MGHKAEHQTQSEFVFMMKWGLSETWEVLVKLLFLQGVLMDMWGNVLRVWKVYMGGGNDIGKRSAEGRRLLEFCDEKELWVANTWFYKANKRKITYSACGCETEIDFVLVGKKYRKYVSNVKVFSWELRYMLVVVDLDKKVLKKVVRKQQIIRRRI